jgi:hypothetical protein
VAELEAEVARLAPMEADLLAARARLASLPGDLATLVAVAVEAIRAELHAHMADDTRHVTRQGPKA